MFKNMCVIGLMCMSGMAVAGGHEIVDTQKYRFEIESKCSSSRGQCNNVEAKMIEKSTGAVEVLAGSEHYTVCADGKSSCYFEGYELTGKGWTFDIDEQSNVKVRLHPVS